MKLFIKKYIVISLVNTMLTLKVACNVTKAGPDGHVTTDVSEELPPVTVTTV